MRSQAPQRPSSIKPEISPALDSVVMRALEKSPGDRFQSADAFILALDNALRAGDELRGGTAAFAPLPPVIVDDAAAAEMDEIEEEERKRRRRLLILAAVAILIGVLIALALTRETTAEVPKVTGRSLERAETRLEGEGFKIGAVREVESENEPETVTEQDPIPGEVDEDCKLFTFFCSKPEVVLTVSTGPGTGKVPSTAGQPLAKASSALEDAGFDVQVDRVNSDKVEDGLVMHSEPSGGSPLTRGSTVVLTVSSGPRLGKVPVLVGYPAATAEQQIRAAGFEPSVTEVPGSHAVYVSRPEAVAEVIERAAREIAGKQPG